MKSMGLALCGIFFASYSLPLPWALITSNARAETGFVFLFFNILNTNFYRGLLDTNCCGSHKNVLHRRAAGRNPSIFSVLLLEYPLKNLISFFTNQTHKLKRYESANSLTKVPSS